MKIAVATASGQLGSAVIKHLKTKIGSDNVVGLARTPKKVAYLGVEIRKGDYDNAQELNDSLKGIDAVLLVTSMSAPEQRIIQHKNVINAAKLNGVKKIVYTGIIGDKKQTGFSPIVQCTFETEELIKASGLDWSLGRNGLYIEPDLEYIDNYVKEGEIRNCAGDGKCSYTSREELGYAYAEMLTDEKHNGHTYNLVGEAISQETLTKYINEVYNTKLVYKPVSVEEYFEDRKQGLGEFLGGIIAGIYESISIGAFDVPSDFEAIVGRPHKPALEIIKEWKAK